MNAVLAIRRGAGLTQEELATRSGVAQPNIAAYEAGRRKPSPAMIERLSKAARPLPHDVVDARRDDVLVIAGKYRIKNVRIFGSTSRRTDTPESDVDLLITIPPKAGLMTVSAFALEVEDLLGLSVDVVSEGGLREDHPIRREAVPL